MYQPSAFSTHAQLVETILDLCRVKESEKAVLLSSRHLTDSDSRPYSEALARKNTDFIRVQIYPTDPSESRPTITRLLSATLREADFVLQVRPFQYPPRFPFISLYSPGFQEILDSGTRWLSIMIDEANQRRLFPTEGMLRLTRRSAERLQQAREIRMISENGTDLILRKDGRKVHRLDGVADRPGMWSNYGFGGVASAPLEESASGVLVLSPADYLMQMNMDVEDEVVLTLDGGKIRDIRGGRTAAHIRRWLESWRDPEAYGIAHIGWGTHPNAVWRDSPLFCVADAESYPGVIQIAFGFNTNPLLAGSRESKAHLDIDLMDKTFYLDGEPIVERGKIVFDEGQHE